MTFEKYATDFSLESVHMEAYPVTISTDCGQRIESLASFGDANRKSRVNVGWPSKSNANVEKYLPCIIP